MLDLMAGTVPDDELAETFGTHEDVELVATYLLGFTVQRLALDRGESVGATLNMLRRSLDDEDGDDGQGGVREPRRPRPSPGSATATMDSE
jgi:hypothetical protein